MILPKYSEAKKHLPREMKNCVNALDMYENDSAMTCAIVITSIKNMLKKIYLSNNLFTEFSSKLYQNKKNIFCNCSYSTYISMFIILTILY